MKSGQYRRPVADRRTHFAEFPKLVLFPSLTFDVSDWIRSTYLLRVKFKRIIAVDLAGPCAFPWSEWSKWRLFFNSKGRFVNFKAEVVV